MESTYKIPNPAVFDGSDTSLGNVNNWAYSVEEYMDLAEIPAAKQTCVAAIFLDKDAKTWDRNNYANSNPSPALKDFLQAFKAQFLVTHSADDIVNRLRDIDQGSDNIGKYFTDFEALVLQLGLETDSRFVKPDYLHGLHYQTRNALIPTMTGQETLKELINKATIIGRNLEYGKSFNEPKTRTSSSAEVKTRSQPSSSVGPRAAATGSTVSSVNRDMDSSGKFVLKLSEPEKDYLRRNNGCFNCRKSKVNHIATDCHEDHSGAGALVKGRFLKKEQVKKESVSALVVESDSESEYSRPKSVPTIKIATQVEGAALPTTLTDCGAMVNVISQDKVIEYAIPTRPMPSMKIHESVNPLGTHVDKKVISKVSIPDDNWESQGKAQFVVAPLQEYDAILGMPFLADEGILVDVAQGKVILPESASQTSLDPPLADANVNPPQSQT